MSTRKDPRAVAWTGPTGRTAELAAYLYRRHGIAVIGCSQSCKPRIHRQSHLPLEEAQRKAPGGGVAFGSVPRL